MGLVRNLIDDLIGLLVSDLIEPVGSEEQFIVYSG